MSETNKKEAGVQEETEKDLPETDKYRQEYIDRFRTLAKSVAACQQPEGYWTRNRECS